VSTLHQETETSFLIADVWKGL